MICVKTCYSFKPTNSFSITKNTSLKTIIFQNHPWLMSSGTLTKKKIVHFSGTLLSHNPFFGQKWHEQPFDQKTTPFKTILSWEVILQSGRPPMACVIARSRQLVRIRKKQKKQRKQKEEFDCHIMHLRNSIKSKRELKRPNSKNVEKNCNKHNSFFSYKELLFSLADYVWDEKWQSFIIPSRIENYLIVSPLSLRNFFL